jgi:hypothetical protein
MKKILFAAPHYFSGQIQVGAQHYSKILSINNWSVLYFSNFLSPFNLMFGNNKGDIKLRLLNTINRGEYINDNLFSQVCLTFLPHHNFTIFDKKFFLDNYYKFSFPHIRKLLKEKGFEDVDVLWLDCANQIFWKNILKYNKSIYRIYDAIEEFPNTGKILLDAHEEAINSCDLILVTSMVNLRELESKHKNVNFVYCPNGVDLSNFLRSAYSQPPEYSLFNNKRALYVGAIDEWFDEELLVYLAEHSPEIEFIIIGPDRLRKMQSIHNANIHYLGPRQFKDIPDYMFYADFGIIPFRNTKLVRCINPIKIYEYFSLGKQVISSSWEELELLNAPCFLAKNKNDFLELIKGSEVMNPDTGSLVNYARANTWEVRLRNTIKLI